MRLQLKRLSKKTLLSAFLVVSIPTFSVAKDLYITGKGGTYSFAVDNNGSSSISGLGAYAVDISYPISNNLMASLIFNILSESVISGDMGYGFDIAIKHYPMSGFGHNKLEDEKIKINVADLYRPYYGIAFRQRQFVLILSTSYVGPGIFGGIDYQWKHDWYLNFEFRYDSLQGPREAVANQMNMLFGLGKEF